MSRVNNIIIFHHMLIILRFFIDDKNIYAHVSSSLQLHCIEIIYYTLYDLLLYIINIT